MDLKKYSILFSVLGIISLYILSFFCRPAYIEISKVEEFEGKQIITKGMVKDIIENKYNNQIITIQENNSTIKVFSEEKTNIEYGDIIEVTGKVQKYEDVWEVVVENSDNINILKKWENTSLPVWQLALNPNRYIGTNVRTKGRIDNLYNSFFYLKDIQTEHKIIVSYEGIKSLYIKPGKEAIVKGVFSYDDENLRYIIKIFNKTHGVSLKG